MTVSTSIICSLTSYFVILTPILRKLTPNREKMWYRTDEMLTLCCLCGSRHYGHFNELEIKKPILNAFTIQNILSCRNTSVKIRKLNQWPVVCFLILHTSTNKERWGCQSDHAKMCKTWDYFYFTRNTVKLLEANVALTTKRANLLLRCENHVKGNICNLTIWLQWEIWIRFITHIKLPACWAQAAVDYQIIIGFLHTLHHPQYIFLLNLKKQDKG